MAVEATRVADLTARCDQELFHAQADVAEKRWAEARLVLAKLLTSLKPESAPGLEALRARAARLLAQVEESLQAERKLHNFFQRRNNAFFLETRFAGLDLPANVRATRAAAREALGVFARAGPEDNWTLPALPTTLTPQERTDISEGCYELLVILAGVVAEALPGEEPRQQAERGLRILDQAARLRPEPTRAYQLRRAACLARAGDRPGEARAIAEADYQRALELLEARPNDELRYVLFVNRGLMRSQRGRLDGAVADFEQAIRVNERPHHAYAGLAQVSERQKRWDEAVEQFTRAIERKPGWAPLYRGRAAVHMGRSDPSPAERAAALADLERAIQYEPPGHAVLAGDQTARGELLRQSRQFEEALAACAAALEVVPGHDPAHRLRVLVLLDLKRYDEAIGGCDAALAAGKPWADIHEIRGVARASSNDFAGAIADYSQALVLQPGEARLLRLRGLAYLAYDAPRPALDDFDAVLRVEPSNAEAHGGRGLALVRLGDHRGAVAAAEESLRYDPTSARRASNAAHICAQAALVAAGEVGAKGEAGVALFHRYQDRAVALVKRALERTPSERRAAFWQNQIRGDAAMRPLQRRLRALQPLNAGVP
jgi:tetratricopeptide (TPR) repeat protein